MLSEFQREAGLAEKSASKSLINNKSSRSMINKTENSYMHQSLVASFMEQEENLSLFGKKQPCEHLNKISACVFTKLLGLPPGVGVVPVHWSVILLF